MKKRINILYFLIVIISLLGFGTIFFHNAEGWSYVDSFYFSTITLTTVGYGDLAPTTNTTKIVTALYAMTGISALIFILTSVASIYIRKQQQYFEKIVDTFSHPRKKRRR